MKRHTFQDFAVLVEQIEAGQSPELTYDQALAILDVARRRRITLSPMTVGYLNTIVNHQAPEKWDHWVETVGSRNRIVFKKVGKRSSLDPEDEP